ncbi:hypothetical protein CB1_000091014 [Camelus ferus]|nr:hypothetical protein CB1_000091014 [Camelus ferus]
MDAANESSEGTPFILPGLTTNPGKQRLLFVLFLVLYVGGILGNGLIVAAIRASPALHAPMYFLLAPLSFADLCFTSVTVPKMLANLMAPDRSICLAGCLSQMYFFFALGVTDSCLLAAMAYDRYWAISGAVLRLPSASGRLRAVSTCGSHLAVVGLFYGTVIAVYFQPTSQYEAERGRVATVMYTVVTPMLNPVIYSLRNRDVQGGLRALFSGRRISAGDS